MLDGFDGERIVLRRRREVRLFLGTVGASYGSVTAARAAG